MGGPALASSLPTCLPVRQVKAQAEEIAKLRCAGMPAQGAPQGEPPAVVSSAGRAAGSHRLTPSAQQGALAGQGGEEAVCAGGKMGRWLQRAAAGAGLQLDERCEIEREDEVGVEDGDKKLAGEGADVAENRVAAISEHEEE